jgi:hypothetical protein
MAFWVNPGIGSKVGENMFDVKGKRRKERGGMARRLFK